MRTDMANKYTDTLERAERHLFRMAFTEYHPEPLAYEEIQELFSEVSSLDIMKLYAEAVKAQTEKMLNVYESLFVDILTNPHNNDRANPKRPSVANDRMNLPPYYPAGTSIRSLEGNPVRYSITDGKLICTETDKEGDAIAVNDVISYIFDGERIVKRLQDEGRDADYIIFFLSQVNQLQDGVLEALDFVRIMFDYLKNQHLKKYNGKTFDSILRKAGRANLKKCEPQIQAVTVTNNEISNAEEAYRHKTSNLSIEELDKRYKALFSYLSPGGISKRAFGCLKEGTNHNLLYRALRGCVLKEISNNNRLDVLYYAFKVYSDYYIFDSDKNKYIEDLDRQISEMNQKANWDKLSTEIKEKIEHFFK